MRRSMGVLCLPGDFSESLATHNAKGTIMMPIKISCGCGQRYAFDVEPVNGRMPSAVACPVCGADGTVAANQIIAQSLPTPSMPVPPPATSAGLRVNTPPPAPPAPEPASAPADPREAFKSSLSRSLDRRAENEKWKWWYFVLAGVCIGGYSIWQAEDQHRLQPLGELFFAVLCVAIGIWDFQYKRRKKRMGS